MRGVFFVLSCLLILTCSCDSQDESMEPVLYRNLLSWDTNLDMNSEYVAVIGDIQEYTSGKGYDWYYGTTMNWIVSQYILGAKIKCVLQTGDLTNSNDKGQYHIFYRYTLPVAEYLPYIACVGNHDYAWNAMSKIDGRNHTLFSEYTSFELTESLIVSRFEEDKMDNIIVKNEIGGMPYYILSLEFGPRKEVLNWADDFVKRHQNYKFILLTHEFLSRAGERISSGSYAELQLKNTSWSSPEEVWQGLVKDNDNIVCVICGHNGFYTHLMSDNANGRAVPQVLFNLQYQENGGNGLLQLWQFPQNSDTVYIGVYNTLLQQWYSGENVERFKFRYKY